MSTQPQRFRICISIAAILCALPFVVAQEEHRPQLEFDMAKNVTRYGVSPDFWRSHVLVLGKISSSIEHRDGANYILRLQPTACTPARFPRGNVIEIEYESAPKLANANAGNLTLGLKEGDVVLVLLRPVFGGSKLPNCVGESFAFMPDKVSLYRVESKDDQNVIDTTSIATVCSIGELSERITAISSLMEGEPSDHLKSFFTTYVESLVSQSESDLNNARTLLENVKKK